MQEKEASGPYRMCSRMREFRPHNKVRMDHYFLCPCKAHDSPRAEVAAHEITQHPSFRRVREFHGEYGIAMMTRRKLSDHYLASATEPHGSPILCG